MAGAFAHHPLKGIYSAPIKLYWCGWETDTHALQQAGWQLSVEQQVMTDSMRIFMQHEGMRMQAMTDAFGFHYRTAFEDFRGAYIRGLKIPVQALGANINIHHHGEISAKAWGSPVDCQPMYQTRQVRRLEDLVHFAPLLTRTNEIILPEPDVADLLASILKMQDPERQARLKAQLREERDGVQFAPRQTVHAQIISIAA